MSVLSWLHRKGVIGQPVDVCQHDWVPLYHGGDAKVGLMSHRVGEICDKCGVRRYDA